jgi:hypothetical protein
VAARADASRGECRRGAQARVGIAEQRVDERWLVATRILDAQQPGASGQPCVGGTSRRAGMTGAGREQYEE